MEARYHFKVCPICGMLYRRRCPLCDDVARATVRDGERLLRQVAQDHEEYDVKTGIALIAAERQRQVAEEGWTKEHDDQYILGDLALAAAVYALPATDRFALKSSQPDHWPWSEEWYKPTPHDRIRELTKAGALIAAEIDRLLRHQEQNDDQR